MAWRVARCLDQLLLQVNAEAPHRSKASDGSIGDAAHASRVSDHNPWVQLNGLGIVTARDFTHDPAGGFDAYRFAEILKARKDPRIKYVISNRRIWSLARDREGWRPYNGENPHTHHTHVSCTYNPALFDRTNPWDLTPPAAPAAPEEDDMSQAQYDALLKAIEKVGDDVRDYALWQVLYGLETEDERAQASQAFVTARAEGKSILEAKAAAIQVLQRLVDDVKQSQKKTQAS
jgi:hypothetical protein